MSFIVTFHNNIFSLKFALLEALGGSGPGDTSPAVQRLLPPHPWRTQEAMASRVSAHKDKLRAYSLHNHFMPK